MLSELFLHIFLYLVVSVVVRGLEGSDRGVGDFRDLFIFHFVEIPEAEYDALLFRQSLDGLVEFSLEFVAIEVYILVDLSFEHCRCIVEGDEGFELMFAKVVQDFVGRDPVEPGVEPRVASECGQGRPYLDEYVLQQVVRILVRA